MQDDVELIAFAKEFGCDAILETLLRIRFSLRDRFCRLGAKRRMEASLQSDDYSNFSY
jgi:hypothetical protein